MILLDQKHALALYRIALAMRCTRGAIVQSTIYNGAGVQRKTQMLSSRHMFHAPLAKHWGFSTFFDPVQNISAFFV